MFLNIVIILIVKKNIFIVIFKKYISNATEKIFPEMKIKYCIWHYKKEHWKFKKK